MSDTSYLLVGSAILLGTLIRIIQYSYNRSFWGDEIALAFNLLQRSFSELFQPLNRDQAAPVGFLLLVKLMIQFGTDERVFRFIPLLSGILSVILFHKVSKYLFSSGVGIAATFIFALLPPLIYYSSELKPYSSDVTVALALYLMAFCVYDEKLTTNKALLMAFAGSLAVWFSFPSLFVLAGIGITLWVLAWHEKQLARFRTLSIVFLCWAASFIVYYFLTLRLVSVNSYLQEFWTDAFIPLPPTRLWHLEYYYRTIPKELAKATGLSYIYVSVGFFLVGCYSLYYRSRPAFFFLISPLILTLLASGLKKYPFNERLILFLVPTFIWFIFEGLVFLRGRMDRTIPWSLVLAALIFFQPITRAAYLLRNPEWKEETKPIFNYLKSALGTEDLIYVYYGAEDAFLYYAPKYGIDKGNVIFGVSSREDLEGYKRDLSQVIGHPRVWVIFSHIRKKEETLMLEYLNSQGIVKDAVIHTDAKAYLYDLLTSTKATIHD